MDARDRREKAIAGRVTRVGDIRCQGSDELARAGYLDEVAELAEVRTAEIGTT